MSDQDGRNEGVLIIIKGSETCQAAEKYLQSVGFGYRLADAEELGILSSLRRDLGVSRLPALVTSSGTFEGLEGIKAFTEEAESYEARKKEEVVR